MLLEVEGNSVHFVKVDLKQTAPHDPKKRFDSESILGALSVNPEELELVGQRTDFHTYYDHKRKLKVTVNCGSNGGRSSSALVSNTTAIRPLGYGT